MGSERNTGRGIVVKINFQKNFFKFDEFHSEILRHTRYETFTTQHRSRVVKCN